MAKCHNERCGAWFSFWWLGGLQLQTRCGQLGTVSLGARYPTWATDRPESLFQGEVRAAIARSSLPTATEYRAAHSQKSDVDYVAQHCPRCQWQSRRRVHRRQAPELELVRGPSGAGAGATRPACDGCSAPLRRCRPRSMRTRGCRRGRLPGGAERIGRAGVLQLVRHLAGSDRRGPVAGSVSGQSRASRSWTWISEPSCWNTGLGGVPAAGAA